EASRSPNGRSPGDAHDAAWSVRFGARVRWAPTTPPRRGGQGGGSGGPPAQARLLAQVAPNERAFEVAGAQRSRFSSATGLRAVMLKRPAQIGGPPGVGPWY